MLVGRPNSRHFFPPNIVLFEIVIPSSTKNDPVYRKQLKLPHNEPLLSGLYLQNNDPHLNF